MKRATQIEFGSGVSVPQGQELVSIIDVKGFKFAVRFYSDIVISTELFLSDMATDAILQKYGKNYGSSKPPGELATEIMDYFNGQRVLFNCKLISPQSVFVLQVYRSLLELEIGQTISYQNLAARSGHPAATRAVGSAMRNNPYPVIVPCHRVIRSDGSLGQYSGASGTATKEYLLKLEKQSGR